MGMVLKYGSFAFNDETTLVPITRAFTFDQKGRRDREQQVWRVRTIIEADDAAAIKTAISALESAMVDGSTLTLYHPNGSTKSPHEITDCKIRSISYPESTGVEYATMRTVEVEFSGDTDASDESDDLVSFQESVSLTGGGKRYVLQETITGAAVWHLVCANSICYARQSGSAVGKTDFPTPATMLFENINLKQEPDIEYATSRTESGELRYAVRWTYEFASPTRLTVTKEIIHEWLEVTP